MKYPKSIRIVLSKRKQNNSVLDKGKIEHKSRVSFIPATETKDSDRTQPRSYLSDRRRSNQNFVNFYYQY